MPREAVRVELPQEIYERLKDLATLTHQPLEEVIFQTIRGNLPPTLDDLAPEGRDLVADLQALNDNALWAVAKESLPAQHWRRHQRLLRSSEQAALTLTQQVELAALREATDRFVMRRSFALALLKWRGHALPTIL